LRPGLCGLRIPAVKESIEGRRRQPARQTPPTSTPILPAAESHRPRSSWRASSGARLPCLAPICLQERIPWRHNAKSKQQLNRRVEHVFLKRTNKPMFHVRAPHEIGYACARTALKSYNSAAPGGLCYVTVPSHFGLSSFPVPRITGSTIANRAREFWFGTKALWTILPEGGAWRGLPHTTRPMTRRSGRSCFTGEKAMSSVQSRSPKFSVTGRRLDAPTPPLLVDQTTTNAIYADRHEFPNAWLLGDHGPLQG